jgi:hypothetical protein
MDIPSIFQVEHGVKKLLSFSRVWSVLLSFGPWPGEKFDFAPHSSP